MKQMTFTLAEGALMLDALDALKRFNLSFHARSGLDALQARISAGLLSFTLGDLKNICLGLEILLSECPMDWKANALLHRLRSEFGIQSQL